MARRGGSRRQDWRTPPKLVAELARRYGRGAFDLDVAASAENHVALPYYTERDDGLAAAWWGRVWCNPPYGDIEPWVAKAIEAVQSEEAEVVVMLLPARPDSNWWAMAETWGRIHAIRGRVAFIDPETGKPARGNAEGSVVVVFERRLEAGDYR